MMKKLRTVVNAIPKDAWQLIGMFTLIVLGLLAFVALLIYVGSSSDRLKEPLTIDTLDLQTPYTCVGEAQRVDEKMIYVIHRDDASGTQGLRLLAVDAPLPAHFMVVEKETRLSWNRRTKTREVLPYQPPP